MPAQQPHYPAAVPSWLQDILNQISVSPGSTAVKSGGEPVLGSIGKLVSELLGSTFEVNPGGKKLPKIPKRLTFSGMSTGGDLERREGKMLMQPSTPNPRSSMISTGVEPQPFEIAPSDLDSLIEGGHVGLEQPPEGAVARIQKKLADILGGKPSGGSGSSGGGSHAIAGELVQEGEQAAPALDPLADLQGPFWDNRREMIADTRARQLRNIERTRNPTPEDLELTRRWREREEAIRRAEGRQ